MKSNKNLKKKDSSSKCKKTICIAIGIMAIGGLSYVVAKQHGDIKALQILSSKTEADLNILKGVVRGNVIHSLRESYKRKLRYAEGRLAACIANDVISIKDEKMRKEEIEFFSKQLENLDAAEALLSR